MTAIKAYDLGRFQRLVGAEGERITGTFKVLSARDDGTAWVSPVDVTIHDETRTFGRVLYSGDFTASVRDGVADLREHMVASNKLADVEEVWDEMLAVLVAAANAAIYDKKEAHK